MATILIDNEFECSIESFIAENTCEGVEPLTETEMLELKNLNVGDSFYIGISEIKRLK